LKVAFDENIPAAMVRVFQLFARERQLQHLLTGLEIKSAKDYTPLPGDPDYIRKNDVPWLKRFAADGGRIVISGNTRMKKVPHERLALIEGNFVVVFFENRWSGWNFCRKCAFLLHWWPEIARTVKRAKPRSFFHIPSTWEDGAKLRRVSNADQRKLKMERQLSARPKPKKERPKRMPKPASSDEPFLPWERGEP